MFNDPTFTDYYRAALEKVKDEILHESDSQILGSEIDDLAKFYHQKYALVPLEYDPAGLAWEFKKEVRNVPANRREDFHRGQGNINWEYESVVIAIPIQPNPNLELIKKLTGPGRYLDGFDESINFSSQEISYSFDKKGYGFDMDEDRIANEINTKSQRLSDLLAQKNSSIVSGNQSFFYEIENLILQRKAKVLADKEKLESLTQKIKIPLKQKAGPGATRIQVSPKDFVRVVKPTPKAPEEYIFEEEKLIPILDFIDFQMRSLEGTPGSVRALGEEDLRDLILAGLNGAFKGDATGETFVKKGKTDIHLKIDKGEILIFECKNWGGAKIYTETIGQLMGYLTWRHSYGVVIMFCKNKDFSKILEQIPGIIQTHSQYTGGYKKIENAHFVSEHSLPEDGGKIIKVHHLIYNLYSE